MKVTRKPQRIVEDKFKNFKPGETNNKMTVALLTERVNDLESVVKELIKVVAK